MTGAMSRRKGATYALTIRREDGDDLILLDARAGLATALLGGLFCALAVAYTPLRRAMNNHRKDT